MYITGTEGLLITSAKEGTWQPGICLVWKITQELMKGFKLNLQEMLITGKGTHD